MWTTMKQRKRCIVLCQGFYEWLKKNDDKEKIPHFVKRKDDQLMCFAGLWDVAKYEGAILLGLESVSVGLRRRLTLEQAKTRSSTRTRSSRLRRILSLASCTIVCR